MYILLPWGPWGPWGPWRPWGPWGPWGFPWTCAILLTMDLLLATGLAGQS